MTPGNLRSRLSRLLGAEPPASAPSIEVLAAQPRDGYVEQRVRFAGAEGDVPAYLLVPDSAGDRAPSPGVVVHHQPQRGPARARTRVPTTPAATPTSSRSGSSAAGC